MYIYSKNAHKAEATLETEHSAVSVRAAKMKRDLLNSLHHGLT